MLPPRTVPWASDCFSFTSPPATLRSRHAGGRLGVIAVSEESKAMTTPVIPGAATDPTFQPEIPPLEAGDRLTRKEFERRYEAMPRIKNAEFLEGQGLISSPLRFRAHGLQ